jgi:hypothetical protein
MKIASLIISIIYFLLDYLYKQSLIKQGEMNVVRQMLERTERRVNAAKNVSDDADRLGDEWLQPTKKSAGRVLPTDEVHRDGGQ